MGRALHRYRAAAVLAGVLVLAGCGVRADVEVARAAPATPTCGGRTATIVGSSLADVLVGTGGADVIVAGGGDDTIRAGGGDDVICGDDGDDIIDGGGGGDTIFGGSGRDAIDGGSGHDRLYGDGSASVHPGCSPRLDVPNNANVVVDVDASGSYATLLVMSRRSDGGWECGTPMSARVGRNGVRALSSRVSGDGTTPAGAFALGTMTAPNGDTFSFFGNGSNPGVPAVRWHQVQSGDCWYLGHNEPAYNTLIRRDRSRCTGESEYLPSYQAAYSQAALIGANMGPDRSGDDPGEVPRAGAIFLHHHSYDASGSTRPTSGCVSLNAADLASVLRQITPSTYFVITI